MYLSLQKVFLLIAVYIFSNGIALADPHYETTYIYYVTDRTPSDISKFSDKFYGKARGDLRFGKASITIPYTHKPGQVDSKPLWSLSSKNNPYKYITLQGVGEQNKNTFFDEIKKLSDSNNARVLLFIPGYHANFEKASKRVAQVVYDIQSNSKLNLIPILFSWPSQGTLLGYKKDEKEIRLSEANLQALLLQLASNLNNGKTYIVAHSMGNRAALGSLQEINNINSELLLKFAHFISIAPDVDAAHFKSQFAPIMHKNVLPLTLYASSTDMILKIAAKKHNAPRLGQADGLLTIMNGLQTIDVSNSHTDLFGHNYFKKGPVIEDIIEILSGNFAPQMRNNLAQRDSVDGKYWIIKPSE
jgi:esterase/lipase superfamily enzyme